MAETQTKGIDHWADLFKEAGLVGLRSTGQSPAAVTRLPLGELKGKAPAVKNIPGRPSNPGEKQEVAPSKSQETKAPQSSTGRIAPKDGSAPEANDGVRRVTGSADIPLNKDGAAQAKQLAKEKATQPFDQVFTSPEKRAVQTAKEFGTPIELAGLDAWRRGSLEGKPVEAVKLQVKYLMLNPDKRPPGKSAESGEAGESLNEFAKPLLATVQSIQSMVGPEERVLVMGHGGNMQLVDVWAKSGMDQDLTFDNKMLAKCPYWTVVGRLFILSPKGLGEVKDNSDPGVYFMEHAQTDFNPGTPERR